MIHIHAAIRALYPNIVTIRDEDAFDKDDKPVVYDMAAAQAKLAEIKSAEEAVKQSALNKLAAIGLTPDEIKSLLGV